MEVIGIALIVVAIGLAGLGITLSIYTKYNKGEEE